MMNTNSPRDFRSLDDLSPLQRAALVDAAKARALALRREAIDEFWSAIRCAIRCAIVRAVKRRPARRRHRAAPST